MKTPLCISTLDLGFFQYGGVVTVTLMFAQIAKEEGFEPFFLTPSLPLHRTIKRTFRFNLSDRLLKNEFRGFPCYQMGAFYPELEHHAHRFNKKALSKILNPDIPCLAVSGNNHAALPFLDLGLDYSVWLASTYWEDCRHRIMQAPWNARKILDLATKPFCEHLENRIFKSAKAISVATTYTRQHTLAIHPSLSVKTTVIPVPVDCTKYCPRSDAQRRSIVFIGRLTDPRKNVHLLLRAFSICASQQNSLQLILIGSGDSSIRSELHQYPFSDQIQWLETISETEKIQHIQNALVLVIPSRQEGFGITGTEALACGVPVISTPCGGTRDFVIPGQTGILLEGFSSSEMADALLKISGDHGFREQLARETREFALKHLSIDAVRSKLKRFIYSQVHS